ncbi:MAG: zinc-ribbon domain-containing protein [Nitrospirota bacterium]
MICIKCKTNISDTAKFCPKCGVKVEIAKAEDVVICPKCGTPNPLTAKFCKKDGTPLREEIKSSETMKEYIKPERIIKKRPKEIAPSEAKRIPIWIAISILVVILAGGSYLYFKKSKEVSVPLQETRTSPDTAVSKKEPATIPIQPPLIPEQS